MRQKGFAPILILLVVVGLGLLAYFSFIYKSPYPSSVQQTISPIPTPTSSTITEPTTNPTANWKIYTNVKYGYSVKYPQGWLPNRGPGNVTDEQLSSSRDVDFYDPTLPGGDPGTGLNIQTNSLDPSGESRNCSNLDDCFAKTFSWLTQLTSIDKQTTNFLGQSAITFNDQRKTELYTQSWKYIYFIYKDHAYSIYISTDTSREKATFSTFDQILSTFKFTQ